MKYTAIQFIPCALAVAAIHAVALSPPIITVITASIPLIFASPLKRVEMPSPKLSIEEPREDGKFSLAEDATVNGIEIDKVVSKQEPVRADWSECARTNRAFKDTTKWNIDYLLNVPGLATIRPGECQRVACQHNEGIEWCSKRNTTWTAPGGYQWIAHAANVLYKECESWHTYGYDYVGGTRHHPDVGIDVTVRNGYKC